MTQYLIMCRSLTHAQRSARLLERQGISAAATKAPQGLSKRGCAYAVSLHKRFDEAIRILRDHEMLTGKLYMRSGETYIEVPT